MTEPHTKALIYCRVSDTKQKIKGSVLESQKHPCHKHFADKLAADSGRLLESIIAVDLGQGDHNEEG